MRSMINVGFWIDKEELEVLELHNVFEEELALVEERNTECTLEEYFDESFNDYTSPEIKGGKFSRVQVQKRYQAKGQRIGLLKEIRDYNAPKLRKLKKISAKLDRLELLDGDITDTTHEVLSGGLVWSSEENEVKDSRQKKPQREESFQRYDYRTRRCAPMTSKSSPFSKIETKEA